MPELPEVQTIVNGLKSHIIKKQISQIRQCRKGTVVSHCHVDEFGQINTLKRRGKYIIITTSKEIKIIIHLGMTGKLIYTIEADVKPSHCRAEIIFTDGGRIFFDDVRTFGKIHLFRINDTVTALENMGVEPLSDSFDVEYLSTKLKQRKAPIKNMLMNQHIVAGLGNIYAMEILHRSHIDPRTRSKDLSTQEITEIVKQTKTVLKEAMMYNGTTVSDYRQIEDKKGEFQNFLRVYQKERCNCGTGIKRIKMAGRSTYFCPECQE
ncbi:MAG: bifunctional DNA-formamidopyrimidine glycosylase/DNA-(apurinic or apyrimidinic site) lyase [bacterium]